MFDLGGKKRCLCKELLAEVGCNKMELKRRIKRRKDYADNVINSTRVSDCDTSDDDSQASIIDDILTLDEDLVENRTRQKMARDKMNGHKARNKNNDEINI